MSKSQPKMCERTMLRILLLLSNRPDGLTPEEIGQTAGPSWRSGATWAGNFVRTLLTRQFVTQYREARGRVVRITEEGLEALDEARRSGELTRATWKTPKMWEYEVLNELRRFQTYVNLQQIRNAINPDLSTQHYRSIMLRLERRNLVTVTQRPSGARPMKLFRISELGRKALHEASSDASSTACLEVRTQASVSSVPDGNASGQNVGVHPVRTA